LGRAKTKNTGGWQCMGRRTNGQFDMTGKGKGKKTHYKGAKKHHPAVGREKGGAQDEVEDNGMMIVIKRS